MSRCCRWVAGTGTGLRFQGDLLGAAALGVRNVLCLTGDDVSAGDQPEARRVFDFDALHLLRTAQIMRDQGVLLSGRKLTTPPEFFLGAAANPFVPPQDLRHLRLAKKIEAGAQFIQTQYWLRRAGVRGVHAAGAGFGAA